jgi:preprotein translocase subunit YajC
MGLWYSAHGLLAQEQGQPEFWVSMLPFAVILMILFPLVIWPQQKEKQKRETMLSGLKKNDRVVTIGGIIGTVANITNDGKEVTLKVDDNTRIRFTRAAISHTMEEAKEEPAKPAT